jgi:hypothetical protein
MILRTFGPNNEDMPGISREILQGNAEEEQVELVRRSKEVLDPKT